MIDPVHRVDAGRFYCPLRSAVHPKVDALAARSLEWMTRIGLCTDDRQRARSMGTNSAEFYGRITPEGLEDRLQIAVDWCYWGFAFDDSWSYEGHDGKRPDELVTLVARLLRMLETLDARLCEGDPCSKALHDVVLRFSRCASPVQLRRWVEAHRLWLFGVTQRHALQARGTTPDIDTYLTMRLHDCGGAPCTAMIDIVNGVEVPSHELDSPRARALTEAAWLVAALDNERVSHAKEIQGEAQVQNLVDVLMHQRGCSPEQALAESIAMRDRMMCLFLRLHGQLDSGAGPALHRYLVDLAHLIPGNIEWSLKTARYTTIYDAGASPIGTVSVSSGWVLDPADDLLEPLPFPSIAWWWDQLA